MSVLKRLMTQRQLVAYRHDGFYASMDTFKTSSNWTTCTLMVTPRGKSGKMRGPREEAAVSILDAAADAT